MSSGKDTEAKVVWLVNKGGHDYTKLERFGRIIPLTTGVANPFNPDRLMLNLGHLLKMASADDYLAISGLPLLNALALTMWLRKFPTAHVLQHSVRENDYIYLRIELAAVDQNLQGD
jgi:hypothetical protein